MSSKSIINQGFESIEISVECNISNGLPSITVVGLASKAVEESKERVRAAVQNSGFVFPRKRITINLAPADIPKESSSLDLAIAVEILKSDKQIVNGMESNSCIFIGELGLDGSIKPVRGLIGKLNNAYSDKHKTVFVPYDNKEQAQLLAKNNIIPVKNLLEIVNHLNGHKILSYLEVPPIHSQEDDSSTIDFSDIYGQEQAKRALLVAASGGHNVLMSGPPGTGKSMLAKAFIGIIPSLSKEQSLEVTHLHSLTSNDFSKIIIKPPLRTPHHTASDIAIIGGGHRLRPGEISLAHNGILFLDEFPEFGRNAIESLRQPLEDKTITVSRAQNTVTFPANFILIATSNPCPCGYLYSNKTCTCSANQIQRYNKKLSGPIMDRIDIHVNVGMINHENLLKNESNRINHALRAQVTATRKIQEERQYILNSELNNKQLKKHANIEKNALELLNNAAKEMDLSPRSYLRAIKVARTIADLEGSKTIKNHHITESLQYRPRKNIY